MRESERGREGESERMRERLFPTHENAIEKLPNIFSFRFFLRLILRQKKPLSSSIPISAPLPSLFSHILLLSLFLFSFFLSVSTHFSFLTTLIFFLSLSFILFPSQTTLSPNPHSIHDQLTTSPTVVFPVTGFLSSAFFSSLSLTVSPLCLYFFLSFSHRSK